MKKPEKIAYISGGCFWGVEELFREQPGVINTEVGYTGGSNDNPDYQNHPGHAEAIAITYDPDKTSYAEILDYFFRIHDPTTLNRQGNDVGSSYRSAIFYNDANELKVAEAMIAKVNDSGIYNKPVVTSLEKFTEF